MTKLVWGNPGAKRYERGVDRGVLYPGIGSLWGWGVAWNGLVSVDENPADVSVESYYFDGVKYNERRSAGDFSATIRAFTYPDRFAEFNGEQETESGLLLTGQEIRNRFGLSYRTLVGDEFAGDAFGYKLHLLYNLSAVPNSTQYKTLSEESELSELEWTITGIPETIPGFRPTVHFILDTRRINKYAIEDLEQYLYGTGSTAPRFPSMTNLLSMIDNWQPVIVTDNGDGTATISGSDDDVREIDAIEQKWSIEDGPSVYLGNDVYRLESEI